MIRIGRCTYKNGRRIDPVFPGFKKIIVMMGGHSKWAPLGPYNLKDENGCILENIWQASKVYATVPRNVEHYSRYDATVIWDHPAETHVRDGKITEEYKAWREKLMHNPYAVRYPVGFHHRHKCLYSLATLDGPPLQYSEARKEIYLPTYMRLARREPKFDELREMLARGENLLIIEVDGPHQESLSYYQAQYGVDEDFIVDGTVAATRDNLQLLLDDPKHPFGHGYCLAAALLQLDLVNPRIQSTQCLNIKKIVYTEFAESPIEERELPNLFTLMPHNDHDTCKAMLFIDETCFGNDVYIGFLLGTVLYLRWHDTFDEPTMDNIGWVDGKLYWYLGRDEPIALFKDTTRKYQPGTYNESGWMHVDLSDEFDAYYKDILRIVSSAKMN